MINTNLQNKINGQLWSFLPDAIEQSFDLGIRAHKVLKVDLYDNQLEIIDAITDLRVNNLCIVECRGAGKSYGVCCGVAFLCIDIDKFQVAYWGPKLDQAKRLVGATQGILKQSLFFDKVDWNATTSEKIIFKNGSQITAITGSEVANTVGGHYHMNVLDESQHISDFTVSQIITPTLGSFKIAKTVKLGVSLYKNHFYKSFNSSAYKKLLRNWTEAPLLMQAGSLMIDGKEYPKYAFDKMPLSLKMKLFPNHPELHYDGDMSEIDFRTQYMIEWIDDIGLELSEEEQKKLASGTFEVLERGVSGHEYVAGLDIAGGALVSSVNPDWTALSIWQGTGGIKQKVACFEWQGNVVEQMKEIFTIINPTDGLFKCKLVVADYGGIGGAVTDMFAEQKIPIVGIKFGERESNTGKNYKNAMFNHFKIELQSNRIQYPKLQELDKNRVMKKAFNEWCVLERRRGSGINDILTSPSGMHDDHPCSDVLGIWGIDKSDQLPKGDAVQYTSLPVGIGGVRSLYNGKVGGTSKRRF